MYFLFSLFFAMTSSGATTSSCLPFKDGYKATVSSVVLAAETGFSSEPTVESPSRPGEYVRYGFRESEKSFADIVFVNAGISQEYDNFLTDYLASEIHKAGFHVVTIGSPVSKKMSVLHPYGIGGRLEKDAQLLHKMQKSILRQLRQKGVQIGGVMQVGPSMGATHTAFVAKLDMKSKNPIGFRRSILVHPPVDLKYSMKELAKMRVIDDSEYGKRFYAGWGAFRGYVFGVISWLFGSRHEKYSDDFYKEFDADVRMTEKEAKHLLFRAFTMDVPTLMKLANQQIKVHFTHDVCFEKGRRGRDGLSKTLLNSRDFMDYVRTVLVPLEHGLYQNCKWDQREQMAQAMAANYHLKSLLPTLRRNPGFHVFVNSGDFLIKKSHISLLRKSLKSRLHVASCDSHYANIPRLVDEIVSVLK